MENKVTFRNAERKDTGLILQFVKELAAYEDMSDDVIADESILETWIFDKQKAEVLFAVVDGTEVGFALFFHNFSTFLGRAGLYLEDLFVKMCIRDRRLPVKKQSLTSLENPVKIFPTFRILRKMSPSAFPSLH